MKLEIKTIDTLEQLDAVDVDGLMEATWDQIEPHYTWPATATSKQDKKDFLKMILRLEVPHDYTLCWCVYDAKTGDDLVLMSGRIEDGGILYNLGFIRPDRAGSKSFVHGNRLKQLTRQLREERGLNRVAVKGFSQGTAQNYFNSRYRNARVTENDDGTVIVRTDGD